MGKLKGRVTKRGEGGEIKRQGHREGEGGKIAPEPQGPRGLILI